MSVLIHTGSMERPYRELGEIVAQVRKGSVFSASPTLEEANLRLQEEALKRGANAVIQVSYDRGMSLLSYEVLTATGTAVWIETEASSPRPAPAEASASRSRGFYRRLGR